MGVVAAGQLRMKAGAERDQRNDVSADANRSARRPRHPRNQLEQRRLARAVASDDPEAGALHDLDRDVVQRANRRVEGAARRAMDLVGFAAEAVDGRRDQIDERARAAGPISLRDAVQLNGDGSGCGRQKVNCFEKNIDPARLRWLSSTYMSAWSTIA